MPIPVHCPTCARKYKAPDGAAGRTLKCLGCGQRMTVPAAPPDPESLLLALDKEAPQTHSEPRASSRSVERPEAPAPKKEWHKQVAPKPDLASLRPLKADETPFWRRNLHWVLALAMIPLAVSMIPGSEETDTLKERWIKTVSEAPPDTQARLFRAADSGASRDELLEILPEQRLQGAWLSRSTYLHWGMAFASAALFSLFLLFLASDGSAEPGAILGVGAITGTVGIGLLFLVQAAAIATEGRFMVGGGIVTLAFYIIKFIGFSYAAAADPEYGFLLSLLGFTFGVGLCEELVKTIPIYFHMEATRGKTWRGLFLWGLASGAGFGIAEGILYSSRYYNGITGPGIYLVRFLSCVALHAIWSGCSALTLYLRRDLFDKIDSWQGWVGPTLVVIGVPMVLHGLYDTCLKRDLNGVALLVAVASFGWLAFLSSRLYGTDDAEANRAMLAEYQRRRKTV
jgi:RsiW-degrading membrane proteinase PrsW (M82 family)